MKRITRWLTIGFCGLTLTAGLTLAATSAVRSRQINQVARIRHGVANGSLTRPEARRLTRNQARLHSSIVRDRADGGVFTPRERAKAQHRLSRQSRAIARQMHDDQNRP